MHDHRRHQRLLGGLHQDVQAGLAIERHLARDHVIERGAQRVDVRPAVHFGRAPSLFDGHVVWRAHGDVFARAGVSGVGFDALGQAQVGQLHLALAARQQDVVRLDVSVYDAVFFGVYKGEGDVLDDAQRA